ncbi:tetratricopeptide repeat protein 27, partial [Tachysurus ichikawai]
MLALAVSCLHLFVQSNWTGPPFVLHDSDFLPVSLLDKHEEVRAALLSILVLDGECVYTLLSNPLLLLMARVLLVSCADKMKNLQ